MIAGATGTAVPTRAAARLWFFGALVLLFIGGLALTRLLFEWQFPNWLWLGRPLPAVGIALALAIGIATVGRSIWRTAEGALALLPLALNLIYLPQPSVDLPASRVLFVGSIWLTAVLLVWERIPDPRDRRWRRLGPLLIALALGPVYLLTMSHAVGAADTFEFQVVAPQLGIAHPTGYPLYLLLAKVSSLLPVGTIAWRVNLASAVFAVLAAMVIFAIARRLLEQPLPALAGALAWGLAPVVWSQAVVAEVYTLHALIVSVALWLMMALIVPGANASAVNQRRLGLALALTIGLGITNHLTSVFLIPAALLTGLFLGNDHRQAANGRVRIDWVYLLLLAAAFALPLLLYLYLPIRWQAVNGAPMGLGRFVEWVAGGRFQDALQWMAWLRDPARYRIVGRLILASWGWFFLLWASVGAVYLWLRQRRALVLLLVTAAGYSFYVLNYYVPDLAVFLLPVHVVIAIAIAAGGAAVIELAQRAAPPFPNRMVISGLVFLLITAPIVVRTSQAWQTRDQSAHDGGEPWARDVLTRPLDLNAAVLADSEKIAPLYYLQQNEGLRPDLDIVVLPDEASYRAELDQRTAAGQTVYLARFLPGLAGAYHLRSVGPLIEARLSPLTALPEDAGPTELVFGAARLLGLAVEAGVSEVPGAAGVTFYWTLERPLNESEEVPVLFARWANTALLLVNGVHPVGNAYPLNAWASGEVVADFHALPVPAGACPEDNSRCELALELAWGPRFASADELDWEPIGRIAVSPPTDLVNGQNLRMQLGNTFLNGSSFQTQIRPDTSLDVVLSGWGETPPTVTLRETPPANVNKRLVRPRTQAPEGPAQVMAVEVAGVGVPGRYTLWSESADGAAVCGWLAPLTAGCSLGEVQVEGAPLPDGATNFDDQAALLQVDIPQTELQPGGQLAVSLRWQALAQMTEDYTVFVQVLDAQDRLVGQVDSWPVQGTFPTSQWTPGETISDPYLVQLSSDLPPGDYRLNIGLYLLATLQRLPVVDSSGVVVDDKLEVGGLTVSP